MRSFISTVLLVASVGLLLGVLERALAAMLLTWKFGFERVEAVHLVPQSFWLFALVFGVLALGTGLLGLLWRRSTLAKGAYMRLLSYAQKLQMMTVGLLLLMFLGGFFVLS